MSWAQLSGIIAENRQVIDSTNAEGPIACPHDGELLEIHGGVRHCPLGDYTWGG